MAIKIISQNRFNGGISESDKEGLAGSFRFGYGLNIYDEPSKISALPKPVKASGTTVTGLIKWVADGSPYDTNMYFYDENGVIYSESSTGVWTLLRTVSGGKGEGLAVHNDYLYYRNGTQIGRYGPLSSSPSFTDNWQTGLTDTTTFGFSPIQVFKEGFAVGHGNKVAWWDGSVWSLSKLTLPPGLYVSTMCIINEYLMIGTNRGTNPSTNEQGSVFAWDGTSVTFNYFNNIDEGGCSVLINRRNQLISVCGTSGVIYGGYDPFQKLHQLPKLTVYNSAVVYPGAATNWKGTTHIGFSGFSSDTGHYRGVYGWGSKTNKYPDALNLNYIISTGNFGSTVRIGAVYGRGNSLYIAWQDSSSYGVDKVSQTNNPQPIARFESLIFDDKRIPQDKNANVVRVDHSALLTGEGIRVYVKRDRADWVLVKEHLYSASDLNNTFTRGEVPQSIARFGEFEWAAEIISNTTTPYVYGISLHIDDLRNEQII